MLDTDKLRPKITPLEIWRIGASFIFVGFGLYFVGSFLLSLGQAARRPWSQLLFGALVLAYGIWRLITGLRNWRRMRARDDA